MANERPSRPYKPKAGVGFKVRRFSIFLPQFAPVHRGRSEVTLRLEMDSPYSGAEIRQISRRSLAA